MLTLLIAETIILFFYIIEIKRAVRGKDMKVAVLNCAAFILSLFLAFLCCADSGSSNFNVLLQIRRCAA